MLPPVLTAWFISLESTLMYIHYKVYSGNRDRNRYRIGDYFFEIRDGNLTIIYDLKTQQKIEFLEDETRYTIDSNFSTLAERVDELLPEAIKHFIPPETAKAYEIMGRLNVSWVDSRFNAILKCLKQGIPA